MLSSSLAGLGYGHPTTKRKCADSPEDFDLKFPDSGSIAKRRRTPASSEALSTISTTAPIAIPTPAASNGIFSFHHAQDAILHHPLPQQPVQMSSLCQLSTPPTETYSGYNYSAPVSSPESVNIMDDDEMMLDENVSLSQDINVTSPSDICIPLYRPPSPLTPLQSNPKPLGPFGRNIALTPVELAGNSQYADGGDIDGNDPMAQVWNRRSRNENKRKNLDGEVIGYKMGFLANCVKCQMKVPGHSGHFIRKNHSV